jgi:hypothetical protein
MTPFATRKDNQDSVSRSVNGRTAGGVWVHHTEQFFRAEGFVQTWQLTSRTAGSARTETFARVRRKGSLLAPRGQPRPAALRKSIRGAQRDYARQIRLGQVFGPATKRAIPQTARRCQPHSQDRCDERDGLERQHGASRSRGTICCRSTGCPAEIDRDTSDPGAWIAKLDIDLVREVWRDVAEIEAAHRVALVQQITA